MKLSPALILGVAVGVATFTFIKRSSGQAVKHDGH